MGLANRAQCKARPLGVFGKKVNHGHIPDLQQVGKKNRSVGATMMNQDSSRSHSIFTITIEMTDKYDPAVAAAAGSDKESHIRVSRGPLHALWFVYPWPVCRFAVLSY